MKLLLIYINPIKEFDEEGKVTVKIQIDNSLELGWKLEDILLYTNFPYEYNGVKSIVIDDNTYSDISSKTSVISYLFDKGLIGDELYWVHDLDAFQDYVITEDEIKEVMGNADIALTDSGATTRWALGSIFFKKSSEDIFRMIKDKVNQEEINEEKALRRLTLKNINNINPRIKKLNISYNFQMWNIGLCYPMAIKPLRVLHFHPFRNFKGMNTLDFFLRGKNKINTMLMSERLVKIFNKYGIV